MTLEIKYITLGLAATNAYLIGDTDTNEAVIHEALAIIDRALGQMMSRELVTSGEVTDVLLDVRLLLTLPAAADA